MTALLESFAFPPRGAAEAFAAAQPLLYRHDPALHRYFYAIQKHVRFEENEDPPAWKQPAPLHRALARACHRAARHAPRRRLAADVLLCGTWLWERPQENDLWARLLEGLLRRGASVLCLIHTGTGLFQRLKRLRAAHRGPGRVTFLDPRGLIGRLDERLGLDLACAKAWRDAQRLRAVLRAGGCSLSARAWPAILWTAAQELAWARWAPHLTFETAVVRCHWLPLCSAVARTGLRCGRKVATLQQGVVSHSLDAPVTAHQMLCFGDASARTLGAMDAAFAQETGRAVTCTDYAPVGSLIDPVLPLENNFERRTVLVVDQSTGWADAFYDLAAQNAALQQLVARLCAAEGGPACRVVIRPHPLGRTLAFWKELAARHPARCVISQPKERSFADDLRRSSVAVGLFSGALTTAAASGLPAYFLDVPGGYRTPDLACFEATQFLSPDALFSEISRLCRDEAFYCGAQTRSRAAAAAYHEGLAQPSGPELADAVLRPLASPPPSTMQARA